MSVSRNAILRLINASQHSACPCHTCNSAAHHGSHHAVNQLRRLATPVNHVEKEYAFEASTSSLWAVLSIELDAGRGLEPPIRRWSYEGSRDGSQEHESHQGWSIPCYNQRRLTLSQVGVFTDPIVARLRPMKTVRSMTQDTREIA